MMTQFATPPRFGTQPIDDDLFSGASPAALDLPTRAACCVCGLRVVDAVPLCGPCRCDLVQTRAYVEETLAKTETRWRAAWEGWEQAIIPHAARWLKVEGARLALSPVAFLQVWAQRKAEGGAFADLLALREELDQISEEVLARRMWATNALKEIARAS